MEKEILLRINLAKVNFTYVEETIAQYFTDGRKPLTIHELARELSISSSSITRFCKKIGLNNFKELMYLYEQHLNMQNAPQISNISLDLQSEYFRIFHLVDQNFDAKAMGQVCRYIYEHRIINIFAFGLSATAAEDFRFRFSRLGKFIEVIHDKDAIKMSSRGIAEAGSGFYLHPAREYLSGGACRRADITGNSCGKHSGKSEQPPEKAQ